MVYKKGEESIVQLVQELKIYIRIRFILDMQRMKVEKIGNEIGEVEKVIKIVILSLIRFQQI